MTALASSARPGLRVPGLVAALLFVCIATGRPATAAAGSVATTGATSALAAASAVATASAAGVAASAAAASSAASEATPDAAAAPAPALATSDAAGATASAQAAPASAATDAPVCTPDGGRPGRPAIGLVLSGGGARGYAHLGVLKVLEANRIPVDCIAATSMGAVVGGLYATGMTAQEMQRRLSQVNLADIAFDVTERADLPQKKREDERLYIDSLTIGFDSKGFKAPVGLVQGNRLQALLANWTAAVPTNQPFDRLPIPFRAIATDLQTGQKVMLDHGSLPLAIRASMALPGLFSPAEIDGRALVDGGLVGNLPVDAARRMGADIVIAVDIGSPLRPLNALASPADVMQQMIGILIRQNVAEQRKQLTPNDILLQPDLGKQTFTDFQTANQAIAAGEAAAVAALPRLARYALSPEQYDAYRAAHRRPPLQPIRITSIDIHTNGASVPKRVVRNALHVKPGDVYDPQAVSADLLSLTTSGNFENVTQQIVNEGDEHRLVIDAQEKYWGPNFLLFGLGMSSSSTDEGGFRLHLGYRRPWLTPSGLEFRADTTLGSDLQSAHVELRQPLSNKIGYYIAPYADYKRRFTNIYDSDTDIKITQYRFQTSRVGLDFGLPLARLGDFRIGLAYTHLSASPTYNMPLEWFLPDNVSLPGTLFPSAYGHQVSARARLVIDQLDDPTFPRKGYFVEARAERSLSKSSDTLFESDAPFTDVYGKVMVAQRFGRHSVNASIEAGKSFGGTNFGNPLGYTLGGFQHLSAYAADQLSGNALLYGQVTYMNQLATFNASPIKALYVGASAEAGNVWTPGTRIGSGSLKQSYTFFTSLTTAFGPVYVGVALAPGGRRNIYFQLGRTY
ncbi:surface antigen variable number repeat family protein [Burkholderia thailandensis USAMRU Malaysia |nr:patatin-like phospholipase family protein [Burkholderia thailandensis]AHI76008.1 surface antigen variable number repeat family protein [Burkholderia thailandensis 2002721723]AHI81742.1 surface antigen variable number repeat family protein [Burkholderia thailandensis E444]AIC90688.1 surface antigen variable number repeat family protein [Burkholderia thailandensis USAMRU Malaysia \